MSTERREELIRQHASEFESLFLQRLDVEDRTMLRKLLSKLLNPEDPKAQ